MIDLFCIASGPSLTKSDCDLVKQYHAKVVAVNNTWEMAGFCDYIYAGDFKWWNQYYSKINISAEKWTCSDKAASRYNINYHCVAGPYNSGMRAIQFGIMKGFKKIALLGYDCSIKNGIHWHGNHIEPVLRNPNSLKVKKWHSQFEKIANQALQHGVEIINCSRHTELTCFKTSGLESELGQ